MFSTAGVRNLTLDLTAKYRSPRLAYTTRVLLVLVQIILILVTLPFSTYSRYISVSFVC